MADSTNQNEERSIRYEDADGWSVMLTSYRSPEFGDAVAAWLTKPNGMRLHACNVNVEFSVKGAAHYLETAKRLSEYLSGHVVGERA